MKFTRFLKLAAAAAIFTSVAVSDTTSFTIHVIGDSTVCNYKENAYPQTGWGQVLGNFFDGSRAKVVNHAIGGRSSKTFIQEGRLEAIKSQAQPGDYMLIQWGPNDRFLGDNSANKQRGRQVPFDSLEYWLVQYVDAALSWKMNPIFVAPMNGNNGTRNLYTEYNVTGLMETLAKRYKIPFVNLNKKSYNYYTSNNADYVTKFLFKSFAAGDYPNYPEGGGDGTHFQEMGSMNHGQFISEELESNLQSNANLSAEAKSALAQLVSTLKKRYTIKVKTNLGNYNGLITQTQYFPAGSPMTLRVIPNGQTFEKWVDDDCNELSRDKIYYGFKTKARDITYTAMFVGGAACSKIAHDVEDVVEGGEVGGDTPEETVVDSLPEELCSVGDGSSKWPSVIETYKPEFGDGFSEDNHLNYTGKGFFNLENSAYSKATYLVTSDQGTDHGRVMIRYSFAGTTNRDMKITIDNGVYDVSFPPTQNWDTWDTVYIDNIWVDALDFKMTLQSASPDGGPNIDMIAFDFDGVYRTGCKALRVTENPESKVDSLETGSSEGIAKRIDTRIERLNHKRSVNLLGRTIPEKNNARGVYLKTR